MTLKSGKLEIEFLKEVLQKFTIPDPRVVIGPGIGEDAAVIDPGKGIDCYWVVTSDPITFTTEEIGYYGVVVNINDIAMRGAVPRWLLATLLFPEKGTDRKLIRKIFRQVHDACSRFNVSWIGGHTEITPGLDRVILSGHMIGEVKKEDLVRTGGARKGDLVLLAKGIPIEGTSIIAREKADQLLKKGFTTSFVKRARSFIFKPGMDVLRASQIATSSGPIHSMHDPTEGGLINGIVEMAIASGKEFEVDLDKVLLYEESKILCREFGLNPFGVIASGALLLTLSPDNLPSVQEAFLKASIPLRVIGRVNQGPARVLSMGKKKKKELKPFPRDEILKIF